MAISKRGRKKSAEPKTSKHVNKKATAVDETKNYAMKQCGGKILEIIGKKNMQYCDSPMSDQDIIFESHPY